MSNKLFEAIYKGNINNIRKLVSEGYDLNNTFDSEDEGKTPLMAATEQDNLKVIKNLLQLGADIFQTTEMREDNIITWCSKWGTSKNFEFLAEYMGKCFNINYANKEGNTSLMLAASYGFTDMLNTILKYEPSLHIKNEDQEDVFDILNNSLINDREATKKELAKLLTQQTISKMKR